MFGFQSWLSEVQILGEYYKYLETNLTCLSLEFHTDYCLDCDHVGRHAFSELEMKMANKGQLRITFKGPLAEKCTCKFKLEAETAKDDLPSLCEWPTNRVLQYVTCFAEANVSGLANYGIWREEGPSTYANGGKAKLNRHWER